MFRRHTIVATLSMFTVGLLVAGCEEEKKATPQVIFEGRLASGGPGNDCRELGDLFQVGDFGNAALEPKVPATPIPDGQEFKGRGVAVSCTVSPIGNDEFDVAGSVLLAGSEGGLFRVDGKFKATGDQENIHAIVAKGTGTKYEQLDRKCVVRYTTAAMGVAAGRIWGEIRCPKVENTGAQTSCEAVAQFRFENCEE